MIVNKKSLNFFSCTRVKITSPERTSPTTEISGDKEADGVNDGAGATGVVSLGEVRVGTGTVASVVFVAAGWTIVNAWMRVSSNDGLLILTMYSPGCTSIRNPYVKEPFALNGAIHVCRILFPATVMSILR
jgi:hypothetical protein